MNNLTTLDLNFKMESWRSRGVSSEVVELCLESAMIKGLGKEVTVKESESESESELVYESN